jgi:hypothetical protein
MPWQLLLNPTSIILIIISVLLLILPIITIKVPEITAIQEPYSFERTSPPKVIHKNLLFFIPLAEGHQSIKNTDNSEGTFYLNFIFDNGVDRRTTREEVTLAPTEEQVVTSTVLLSGMTSPP